MILSSSKRPTKQSRLWILVFDGMRFDTWEEVVKKVLSSIFDVVDEKLYFCTLPSVTDIARVSLLAGKLPDDWTDYNRKETTDHRILASRLFGLKKEYAKDNLRVIVASETDFGQRKLDADTMPYNILIYNLSDDWIHRIKKRQKDRGFRRYKGNRKGDYSLLIELDSGLTKSFKRKLEPTKKRQEVFEFTPELNMRTIRFELTYTDIDKIERRLTKRIGIVVIPKKGKIEIDTSALDRLDL